MKGMTAALTPPLPKEKRKALTPSPAAAVPSCASAAGTDVNKSTKAPKKTILLTVSVIDISFAVSSKENLHGGNKYRSEAPQPRISDDCTQDGGEVGKGHEAIHDKRCSCLLQAQCSRDLAVSVMLKIVLCNASAKTTASILGWSCLYVMDL